MLCMDCFNCNDSKLNIGLLNWNSFWDWAKIFNGQNFFRRLKVSRHSLPLLTTNWPQKDFLNEKSGKRCKNDISSEDGLLYDERYFFVGAQDTGGQIDLDESYIRIRIAETWPACISPREVLLRYHATQTRRPWPRHHRSTHKFNATPVAPRTKPFAAAQLATERDRERGAQISLAQCKRQDTSCECVELMRRQFHSGFTFPPNAPPQCNIDYTQFINQRCLSHGIQTT